MNEPTAGSELVCVWATKISNPACILHPEAMRSCFSQQFLRKTMRGRIKISCPVTCVKIKCVCISLGARQRRIIGSQSPSRKGRHNTNMTLFIEGEDINCSRRLLGEDGVTCCLEFPIPPHLWRWAPIGPELLTRNVSYLESDIISRSWRKVVLRKVIQDTRTYEVAASPASTVPASSGLHPMNLWLTFYYRQWHGFWYAFATMPKSSFLIDLNWILSELQLGLQLRPSKVVEMVYHTAQETAQEL